MNDRSQGRWRTHTITLGAVLVVMGLYAFSPFDTLFTATLARLDLETAWGTVMVGSGSLLALTAGTTHRYMRWAGNMGGMLAGGWTWASCWNHMMLTPTVAACAVIAVGCAVTMLRDAVYGRRYRCQMRQTQQWEALANGD